MQFSSSQPDLAAGGWEALLLISQNDGQVSFSQPTKPEHMLLGSQLLGTPGASQVIHTIFAKKKPKTFRSRTHRFLKKKNHFVPSHYVV